MNLRTITFCALVALLCACAATSVQNSSKAPDYQGGPFTKAAVLAVDERADLRKGFENRLAYQIQQRGGGAMTTYDLLSLPEINQDKPAAAERFRAAGADVVVIMRLKDIVNSYRETRPGHERYGEIITGFETGVWYDYYSVAFMDMSATYGNLKQRVFLETGVFDLKTAKRRWSGVTETTFTERMDRLEELDTIIAKVIAAMRKDGVAP